MGRRALGALLLVLVAMPSGVACIRCLSGGCDGGVESVDSAHPTVELAPDCHAQEPPPCHADREAPSHCSDSRLEAVRADCCTTMADALSWTPALLTKAMEVPGPAMPEPGGVSALPNDWDRSRDRRSAWPPPRTRNVPIYTLHSSLLI